MKSKAFNVQIFTKLINDQQHYIHIYMEFHSNWTKIGVTINFCIKAQYS